MSIYSSKSFADLEPDVGTIICTGNISLHKLKIVLDSVRGNLSVGNFSQEIPFDPKRYFLVFDVPSQEYRGQHAHHECHQFLICIQGSINIEIDDGNNSTEVLLDSPGVGVYLPPLTWATQCNHSSDSILLVFASHVYEEKDYIRDYEDFLKLIDSTLAT